MNIKLTSICLGGLVALTSFVPRPVLADEWNKKTELVSQEQRSTFTPTERTIAPVGFRPGT
jgi:hypothetical protein